MRRNSRAAALVCLLLALCLTAGGCGAAGADSGEKHRVALVAKSTSTEFWKSVFAGAEAAATEYNLELTIAGPETEEDFETQNRMVADAVANGAEALVFSAIDFANNAPAIDDAAKAGTKIVTIDSGVNSAAVATYIGTDNYAAGQQAAAAALLCGYPHLYVGLVNYDINSANGQQREKGVREVFSALDNVTMSAVVNSLAIAANAQADTVTMLKNHPEINVLIAFNEPTAVGAARAVRELKKGGNTWLVGFDSNVETVDQLQTGVVDALIVQNPYAMGYLGVESAARLLSGQAGAVAPTVDTATYLVEQKNMFTAESQRALFAFS